MPVINGVYLKDFPALPSAVADANIIPIAIAGNQIAYKTTVAGIVTDARVTSKLLTGLSVTGSTILATDTILQAFGKVQNQLNGKVSSVGLTMPAAFNVANSPITSAGTLAVTAAGLASQYIRGDGALADFPTTGGGGSSVAYYLNGSVSQGTIGGNTYYEMNKTPIIGTGTDFSIAADGYIAQFITDANDPASLLIPAGNWNVEMYFSSSSSGGTPSFYVEVYKYDGTTFTLLGSSATTPEGITNGTAIDIYYTSVGIPETVLTITDRLAIRVYVTHSGRTITLHTEDNHLSEIITTFSNGLTTLNGLTKQAQYFATGTTGTDFNISSSVDTHTFNIPSASASNRGLITTGAQTIAGDKTFSVDTVVNGVNIGRGGGNIVSNTANGNAALISNTTGAGNTASGYQALFSNTTGSTNTGNGVQALFSNTTGGNNTAYGVQALYNNTIGTSNTASGYNALFSNTTGSTNTGNGFNVLFSNTTGGNNTGNGIQALYYNTTGGNNTANGVQAGSANTTGSNNIFLGYNSTGESATESNRTWIGNTDTTSTWVGGNLLLGTRTNATSDKLQVTGSAKITGQLTLGSTITNGTYTYTLPSATGTLALTSALSAYVPYTGATGDVDLGTNNSITLADTSTNTSINITSSSTGSGAILVNKSGAGTGIRVDNNGTGFGFYANNSSTGYGITIGNLSTGIGLYIDNAASATGDPFVYTLGGASFVKAKIDYLGNITGVAATLTGALTGTSATFSGVVTFAGNTRYGVSKIYDASIGDGFGFEQVSAAQVSQGVPMTRIFTAATNGAALSLGKYTSATAFTDWLLFSSTGAATFSSSIAGTSATFTIPSESPASGNVALTAKTSNGGNDIFRWYDGATQLGVFKNSGNVGIGTTSPNRALEILSTSTQLRLSYDASVYSEIRSDSSGGLLVSAANSYMIFYTNSTERMRIAASGAVTIAGSLSKGSGSFRIEHPLPSLSETHQLVHSFIEGPQADLIYRGKLTLVNGKAQANIDEVSTMTEGTFEVLCREVQCFTTNESGWDLVKGKVIGNIIYIESQNEDSKDEISWMVIGERKDKHMMDTEWTDENGKVIVEPLKPIEPEPMEEIEPIIPEATTEPIIPTDNNLE